MQDGVPAQANVASWRGPGMLLGDTRDLPLLRRLVKQGDQMVVRAGSEVLVPHSHVDRTVPHPLLYLEKGHAGAHEVAREGMAEISDVVTDAVERALERE
jgi:hypothetical protein